MRNYYSEEERRRNEDLFQTGTMNWFLVFLAGLGTGAAIMYLMDPDRGRRRRALLKDQAVGLTNDAREAINATTEDLSNRAYGLYAETRKAVTGNPVSTGTEAQAAENQKNELNTELRDRSETYQTNQSDTDQTDDTSSNTEFGRSATQP